MTTADLWALAFVSARLPARPRPDLHLILTALHPDCSARSARAPGRPAGGRPEHFHRPVPGEHAYTTSLSIVEPLGANILCYGQLGRTDIVASLNPSELAGARADEVLHLAVDLSKTSIFDASTSLRL